MFKSMDLSHIKFTNMPLGNVTHIVIHHTASRANSTPAQIDRDHRDGRGWLAIGYHVHIDTNGVVTLCRPLDAMGAHCSENGMNRASWGVVLNGHFEEHPPTMAQMDSLVKVINWLREKKPIVEVAGHSDFQATLCPGKLFPWDALRRRLSPPKEEVKGPPAYTCSPQFADAIELVRSKGLSNPPKGWDYTQPISEERFWEILRRVMKW